MSVAGSGTGRSGAEYGCGAEHRGEKPGRNVRGAGRLVAATSVAVWCEHTIRAGGKAKSARAKSWERSLRGLNWRGSVTLALPNDEKAWIERMSGILGRPRATGGQTGEAARDGILAYTRVAQASTGANVKSQVPSKGTPTSDEILAAQRLVNDWRITKGLAKIVETGVLDADTIKALAEYKQGITGDVKSSPVFTKLGSDLKAKVLARMESFADDVRTVDNVGPLQRLVTESGFQDLPEAVQKQLLNILAAKPNDGDLSNTLRRLVEPNFKDIPAATQTLLLKRLYSFVGNSTKVKNFDNLVSNNITFHLLPDAVRNHLITMALGQAEDTELIENITRTYGVPAFVDLEPQMQIEILDRVAGYPREIIYPFNLMTFASAPGFFDLAMDVRDDLLDPVPYPYDTTRGDGVINNNVMSVVQGRQFEKLPRELRKLLLSQLAARPENIQLATAFRELVDRGSLQDARSARQKIMDADARVP